MAQFDVASVHGRFQPLHLQHLDYIELAFQRADFLFIGLTQPTISSMDGIAGDPAHRSDPQSNPLTYFERTTLIEETLLAVGHDPSEFGIIPFPIEHPEQLIEYLAIDIPVLTTRVDEWNDTKIKRLSNAGYAVEVLVERQVKEVSGERLRDFMRDGDPQWVNLVHPRTAELLTEWRIPDRLRSGTK